LIVFQLLTIVLLIGLVFLELRKWRELVLVGFSVSLTLSIPNLSVFYKNYILLLTFIVSFILLFFRKTFPSIVYNIDIKGQKSSKFSLITFSGLIIVLLNILQLKTNVLLSKTLNYNSSALINISSEQILRYTAIALMFITVSIVRTGDLDD